MSNDQRIERIALLSRRLRRATWAAVALALVVTFVAILGIGFGAEAKVTLEGNTVQVRDLTVVEGVVLMLMLSPIFGLGGWLLVQWDRLLRLYEHGVIFSRENAATIRRAGQLLIAIAVLDTVLMPIAATLLARIADPGRIEVEPNVGLFLVGCAIIVVGHVMRLGAEMAEEASLTI